MPVNLSIKGVPDHIAVEVRRRAAEHHRSLQGELMAILEEQVAATRPLTPAALLAEVRGMKLRTGGDSANIVRQERDGRAGR